MAKHRDASTDTEIEQPVDQQGTDQSTETTGAAEGEAPKPTILTISGLQFSVDPKYSAGHVVSQNEANALNQTRAENLRNNFASKVKAAIASTKLAAYKALDLSDEQIKGLTEEQVAEYSTLSEAVVSELEAEFAKYAQEYEFASGVRRSAAPVDPIGKEAWKMAKEIVVSHLKGAGYDLKTVENLDEMVQDMLDGNPVIREEAERRIEQQRKLAALTMPKAA